MSPTMKVTLDVDGEVVVETIGGCVDGADAIKKAMKKHPTLVLGVIPLEVQTSLDDPEPHEHPGQTNIDDRPDLALEMDPPDEPLDEEGDPVANGADYPEAPVDLMQALEDSLQPDAPEADGPDEVGDDPFAEDLDVPEGQFHSSPALDPAVLEAELAAMRGPDGSDEDGFDS